MSRRSYSGAAEATTLQSGINSSALSAVVAAAVGFPDTVNGPFVVTIDRDTTSEEKVLVSNVVGTAITFSQRGFDGTTAKDHSAGATFEHTFSAKDADEANEHVNRTTNIHGLGVGDGSLVGTTKVQTLTNKTIDGSQNSVVNIPDTSVPGLGTHAADTSTHGVGEVVGTTETQSLTNKTLIAPTINGGAVNAASLRENGISVVLPETSDRLKNKIIDGGENVLQNIATGSPGERANLVDLASAQILTNKSLVAPDLSGPVDVSVSGTTNGLVIKQAVGSSGDMLRVENVVNIPVFVVDKTGAVNSIVGTGSFGSWDSFVANPTGFTSVTYSIDARAKKVGRTVVGSIAFRLNSVTTLGSSIIQFGLPYAVASSFDPYSLGWCPIGSADYRTAGGTYVTGHCYVTGANATTVRVRIPQPGGSTPNLATFAGNYPSGLGAGDAIILNFTYETDDNTN